MSGWWEDATIYHGALVAVGGVVGAMVRHRVARSGIPRWARTWTVNLVGSALLGVLVGAAVPPPILLLLGTGLCGALTTVSSLMLEATEQPRRSGTRLIGNHVVLGLLLAGVGLLAGHLGRTLLVA